MNNEIHTIFNVSSLLFFVDETNDETDSIDLRTNPF